MKITLIQAHVLEGLKKIPDNSIDCIITSPPYWGLRKYPDSANVVWDGDPNCQHEWEIEEVKTPIDHNQVQSEYFKSKISKGAQITAKLPSKQGFCFKCGAWFGQLGLEPTLELYIEHLLQVTAELKRVLKPTGVMFWNHGDSYIGSLQGFGIKDPNYKPTGFQDPRTQEQYVSHYQRPPLADYKKLPAKCMAMQNYRLALRMIDEQGWILRNIIIWHKPNHLPESVKDRFTKAYEPIFMFVKNKKYFFDLDAVREPIKQISVERYERALNYGSMFAPDSKAALGIQQGLGYPKMPPKSFSFNYRVREAKKGYFGKLGVKASEEEMKKYDEQGRPISKYPEWEKVKNDKNSELEVGGIGRFWSWQRKVGRTNWKELVRNDERAKEALKQGMHTFYTHSRRVKHDIAVGRVGNFSYEDPLHTRPTYPLGKNPGDVWIITTQPFPEAHFATFPGELVRRCIKAGCPKDGIVLDPFVGSGTTLKVAIEERRNAIGIEIVPEYVEMTIRRCNLKNNPLIDFEQVIE